MVTKLQISSRENLAVHAKDWYLNLWVCVSILLANKTRAAEGKVTEQRKMKARERLFGGRGLCENVNETWRKSTEKKRHFRQKTEDPGLVSALESNQSLFELPQVLSGSATEKKKKKEEQCFCLQNRFNVFQCTLIPLAFWESTTCGGCP